MSAVHPLLAVGAVHVLATLVAAAVAMIAWHRRRATPSAYGLTLTGTGLALWSGLDAASVLHAARGGSPEPLLHLMEWILPASLLGVGGFVLTARSVRHHDRPVIGPALMGLMVAPAAAALTASVWPGHIVRLGSPVYRAGEWGLRWQPSLLFEVATGYAFAASALGLGLLISAGRHASALQRRQARSILIGSLFPALGDVVTLVFGRSTALPDVAGISMVISLVITGHALVRLGLLQTVPVARGMVLDRLMDAVFVIGSKGELLDVNAAGAQLLRVTRPGSSGNCDGLPFPPESGEHTIASPAADLLLDVRTEGIVDARGRQLGRLVVARDVTELHRRREELARANIQLRHQVDTIESLRAELAELAVRDELTGLYNRRHLVAALDRELLLTEAGRGPLSLVLLDLDHFKSINDTHGHDVGDDVLRATAGYLRDHARSDDVVARFGGEEFVVLLPGLPEDAAVLAVDQWREGLSQIVVPAVSGPVRVTTSAGVASLRPGLETGRDLLKAADLALYQAKTAGRNRVVAAASTA